MAYLEERPPETEGPFVAEERTLIDMLADMLRIYLTKREAVGALQKSEANLRTIFDNTDTMYGLINEKYKVVAFNQRGAAFCEKAFSKTLTVGTDLIDYFPPDRQAKVLSNLKKVMQGKHISYEVSYPQTNGKLNWYYLRMYPILNIDKAVFGIMLAVSDITETKRLEQEVLEQKVQEQKMMTRAILVGEERERNKIGQELHDNVNQILAGTKLYLSIARQAKEGEKGIIDESIGLIDKAIEEIRALSKDKVTPMKHVNLEELLETLLSNLSATTDIAAILDYKGSGQWIEDDLKLSIYRIIQESVTNILKHANAKNVSVLVDMGISNIRIIITDDGKGYDTSIRKNGIGISNMINRVESFNGTITFESSPGMGCKTEILLPF